MGRGKGEGEAKTPSTVRLVHVGQRGRRMKISIIIGVENSVFVPLGAVDRSNAMALYDEL